MQDKNLRSFFEKTTVKKHLEHLDDSSRVNSKKTITENNSGSELRSAYSLEKDYSKPKESSKIVSK